MDDARIEAAAQAHYEAGTDYTESPAGGFTRWARWDELTPEYKARLLRQMRAAAEILEEPR